MNFRAAFSVRRLLAYFSQQISRLHSRIIDIDICHAGYILLTISSSLGSCTAIIRLGGEETLANLRHEGKKYLCLSQKYQY